jgi:hypothetical protein
MAASLWVTDPMASPGGKLTPAVSTQFRIDEQGGLIVGNLEGRFREQTHRLHNFGVCTINIAGQATSVGFTTTYTGLYLYNPIGNPYVASINMISSGGLVGEVAPAPLLLGMVGGAGTVAETSTLVPFCTSIGSSQASTMHAGLTATLTTPVSVFPLNGLAVVATAAKAQSGPIWFDGAFELLPGKCIMIVAVTAWTGFLGIYWTENPL